MSKGTIALTKHSVNHFVIRKRTVSVVILFFFIVAPKFVSVEIVSLMMLLFLAAWILIISPFRIPRGLSFLIGPIGVLMIVGILGSLGNTPYNIVKDIWYVGRPILALLVGYVLMLHIRDFKSLLIIVIIAAAIVSLFHVLQFVNTSALLDESIQDIREEAGRRGSLISVIAILAIAACWRAGIMVLPNNRWFVKLTLILCFMSLVLSFSRTIWLSLLVMSVFVLGLINFKRMKNVLLFTGLAILFTVVVLVTPESERKGPGKTFMGKWANSVQEVIIQDYREEADIIRNWRGYEAFCAFKTYSDGEWFEYFVGKGFGTLIDLGFYMKLGGTEHRHIPILHNGYLYIIVKTGLIGLFVYLFYLVRLIIFGRESRRSGDSQLYIAGNFIVALSVVILMTTWVISGLFNRTILLPAIILLGAFISYARFPAHSISLSGERQ